jgi:hypothetical protein
MKKNRIALIGITFILGAVFGISLLSLLSFTKPPAAPAPNSPPQELTIDQANKYFLNYFRNAPSISEKKFKGMIIDRQQLEAINALAANQKLVAFRVYMGLTDKYEAISIVVGLVGTDKPFQDATDAALGSSTIYRTESKNTSPCPYICDNNSPITKGSE